MARFVVRVFIIQVCDNCRHRVKIRLTANQLLLERGDRSDVTRARTAFIGATVIPGPLDAARINDAVVLVDEEGRIAAVGARPNVPVPADYERVDLSGRYLLPGLINGHTHAAMSLLRGIGDDRELMDWLLNYIFPAEVRFVDPRARQSATIDSR